MDIQVQELIDKIKKEGIEAATQDASRVRAEAEAEARRIIDSAKREADDIISRGKQDAQRSEQAGIAALEQASRNLVLAFKDEIQALLEKLVASQVNAAYNQDVLKTTLPSLLKSWAEKSGNDIALLLPENELSSLQAFFNEKLKDELKKGVELKSNRKLAAGFHISNKEGSFYYDFSAEAVALMLSSYLNPKLAEILKNSSKGI